MKCKFCNREISPAHVDLICDRCWELKSRIEADLELAGRFCRLLLDERGKRSALGENLRNALIDHVAAAQAWESDLTCDVLDCWAEFLKNGVVGLTHYSDLDLLKKFARVESGDLEGAAATLGPELAAKLTDCPLWAEVLTKAKSKREEDGELEAEVGPE